MDEDLIPIVQKTYDFSVPLYSYIDRFPRAQKTLLGREILSLALRLLVQLITANRQANKIPDLQEASGTLDALRITLRLAKQLSFLSNKGYEVLSQDLTEIGRMLGGWLKQSAVASVDMREARPVRGDGSTKRQGAAGPVPDDGSPCRTLSQGEAGAPPGDRVREERGVSTDFLR